MLKLLTRTNFNQKSVKNSYRLFNSLQHNSQLKYTKRVQLPLLDSRCELNSPSVRLNKTNASSKKDKPLELARQPVPKLADTMKTWLRTVRPVISEIEYEKICEEAKEFECNEGKKLQELLEKRAAKEENWLSAWWLKVAYLDYRIPVTINVSPGLVFPPRYFRDDGALLIYGARLIKSMLNYKSAIDRGDIKQEMKGQMPLDMQQYHKIFGTCRIPGCETDSVSFNDSDYIIVMYSNNFYKVQVFDCKGNALHEPNLIDQLGECIKCQEVGPPIGLLTSENRTKWAQAYNLLSKNDQNRQNLTDIEKSLFVICIDQNVPIEINDQYNVASHLCIHGMGPHVNLANRWMDKTIQLILNPNGLTGFTYEHSPAEGQPVAILVDMMLNQVKDFDINSFENTPQNMYDPPRKLNWDITCVDHIIADAIKTTEYNSDNLSVNVLHFTDYGKNFIKKQKLSPDSFIQMAMQYAFLLMHCEPGVHYETAQQRIFLHGRTETIRSCSIESVEFARAMKNKKMSPEEKVELLRKAVNGHQEYTKMASDGYGVDRHLLGLKMSAIECGMEVPKFLNSKAMTKSSHYRIATSQVALRQAGFMTYGPIVDDGYGICYNPRDDDIFLAVSSFNSCAETDAAKMSHTLREALLDMACVLTSAKPKSKL